MSIEAHNRIINRRLAIKKQIKDHQTTKAGAKSRRKGFFRNMNANKAINCWVENACARIKKTGRVCGEGMSRGIYEFQKKNRPGGPICSRCSIQEDKKALKELDKK